MKKQWKRAVSIGCAACMLASTMPMGFNLVAEAQGIEIQSDEAATSGTWGTCEWNLDENGVLTISGGVAESLGGKGAPWRNICKQIQEINITGNIDFNKTFTNGAAPQGSAIFLLLAAGKHLDRRRAAWYSIICMTVTVNRTAALRQENPQ